MERDPELEGDLLDRVAASPEFVDQVLERLATYEARHGNTGWDQAVDALLQEILEETADVCGWGIGAAYKLDRDLWHRLVVAIRLAAAAAREISEIRETIATRR